MSAYTGEGIVTLEERLAETFTESMMRGWVELPAAAGRLRAQLYEEKAVEAEQTTADGQIQLRLSLPQRRFRQLVSDAGLNPEQIEIAFDETPSTAVGQ